MTPFRRTALRPSPALLSLLVLLPGLVPAAPAAGAAEVVERILVPVSYTHLTLPTILRV